MNDHETDAHENAPRDYHALLDDARQNPSTSDFHALRMAYTRSGVYNPYFQDADTIDRLRRALVSGDMESALESAHALLVINYLDTEAHMAADYAYTQLEERARSAYHRAFAHGLIEAILATGTGRDFATAFIVINVSEEYTVLRVMGLVPGGQRLVGHDGHWFDVLTARQPASGDTYELYFNIDLPRGWLLDHMGGSTNGSPGDQNR